LCDGVFSSSTNLREHERIHKRKGIKRFQVILQEAKMTT
jgi:hypothetical protein